MCTVCVARYWWKTLVDYQGLQLTNNSNMHGTSLALMVAYSASSFHFPGKVEPQRYKGKMRCKSA